MSTCPYSYAGHADTLIIGQSDVFMQFVNSTENVERLVSEAIDISQNIVDHLQSILQYLEYENFVESIRCGLKKNRSLVEESNFTFSQRIQNQLGLTSTPKFLAYILSEGVSVLYHLKSDEKANEYIDLLIEQVDVNRL